MLTNEHPVPIVDDKTPIVRPGNYSPVMVTVDMKETLGVLFLGIFASFTLIGWMRAEARLRALVKEVRPA